MVRGHSMATLFSESEMAALTEAISTYEQLTGLIAHTITYDDRALQIQWAYPDNVWAGTTSYTQPIAEVLHKLSRQIKDEYNQLQAGEPRLVDFVAEIQRAPYQLAVAV